MLNNYFPKLNKKYLNYIHFIVLALIIILLVCLIYFFNKTTSNIEKFTNNNNSFTLDLYSKLNNDGDYNDIGNIRIIKTTLLKGSKEKGYQDICDPSYKYLDKIKLKRKMAIDAKDNIISRNKKTNFSIMDGNNESISKLFLINNDDASAGSNVINNSSGYYEFKIVGKTRDGSKDKWFRFDIYIKEKDVNSVKINKKEDNDTISKIEKDNEIYYVVTGYVDSGDDYVIFKATNPKSFLVQLTLTDKNNVDINYWDVLVELRDYYTSSDGRRINPMSQDSSTGKLTSKFLCERHLSYDANFDVVPTKNMNFYKLKSNPDYTNNIIFENTLDSYGEGIHEDETKVKYNPFNWGGILYNQQEDVIGMSRSTWDRFAINKYDYDDLKPGLMYREWKKTSGFHPSNRDQFDDMFKNYKEYINDDLSRYTRVVGQIKNFSLKKDNYIVDFRGFFKPSQSGYYRFGISCDDAGMILLKDWNTMVANWFGGHGSYGTSRPGGQSVGVHYLDVNNYYFFWAAFEEMGGRDDITVFYKYYKTQNDANNDKNYMSNGTMKIIPENMFYHRNYDIESRGIKFMSNEDFTQGNIDKNVYQKMVDNDYEKELVIGDINQQIVNIQFVNDEDYKTHNIRVEYDFNNIILDDDISIIQFEFENNQTYNKFLKHFKTIYVGSNNTIKKENFEWDKTYSSYDTKFLILLKSDGSFTQEDIDIWAKEVFGIMANDKRYYSVVSFNYE